MKSLIYLVVLFLLFNGFNANKVANSLIRDSCKNATKYDEPYVYDLCVASIQENPESKKVRNMNELILIGTKNAMSNMTNVKGIAEKILKERKYKSKLSAKLLRDCLKLYSEGIQWITKALESFKLREYKEVYYNLGDARTVPRTCEMGFNGDNEQISPVAKENEDLFEMVNIPYMFTFAAYVEEKPL